MNNSQAQSMKHRKKFSLNEDCKLKQLVKIYGENDWAQIAAMMNNRNARQCRDRYKYFLAPDINKNPWSLEEEMKLDVLVQMYGKKWSKLTSYFPKRTDINLKCHYTMLERRKQKMILKNNGLLATKEPIKETKIENSPILNRTEPLIFTLQEEDLGDFFEAFDF